MRGRRREPGLSVLRQRLRVDVVRRRASQQPRQLPEADAKTHAWSDAWSDASPDASKSNSTAIAVSFAAPHGVSDAEAYTDSYAAADARTLGRITNSSLTSAANISKTMPGFSTPPPRLQLYYGSQKKTHP